MAKTDITYLKKRSEMTKDFYDNKVQAMLAKIIPPQISIPEIDTPKHSGFDCVVPNKFLRNWIDLIPENYCNFMRFIYEEGHETDELRYIKIAMTKPSWKRFQSLIIKELKESDLFLMRWVIWHSIILKTPVGIDFGKYEMNLIFNSLPINISNKKFKIEAPSFSDFYRQIMFVKWGLEDAN